jgi:ABC-type antimicrobial peptide transport system permease subunit
MGDYTISQQPNSIKLINEKKASLLYFLLVLAISFIMYTIIQVLAKDECQNVDEECYEQWSIPFGNIWLTVLITFIVTVFIWVISYFYLTKIEFIL